MNRRVVAFWLLFAVTCVVFVCDVGWSLQYVTDQAEGLEAFDLRTDGYDFQQAQAFLAALSPEGYAHYQSIQQPLGILFIGLYAVTFFFAIQALVPATWSNLAYRVLPLLSLLPAVFDLLENRAVTGLVAAGAGNITPEAVDAANQWTLLKRDTGVPLLFFIVFLFVIKAVAFVRARMGTPQS